jgi:hypothetical protein
MERHEHRNDWRTIAFYGVVSLLVLGIGGFALLTFFRRESLRRSIAAEPLPRVTVVTSDPANHLAAAWTDLLTRAGVSATLVSSDHYTRPVTAPGVIALCDVEVISPQLEAAIATQLREHGGVLLLGSVAKSEALRSFTTAKGISSGVVRFGDAPSPLLARVDPGHEVGARTSEIALLEETPAMSVDARWSGNARAAIAHLATGGGRIVWFGLDPSELNFRDDRHLALLLRTTLRWIDGQPVSDGAVGSLAAAKALTAQARMEARRKRFTFSVDRLGDAGPLGVRIVNRGSARLANPTVKLWLPSGSERVVLDADILMRRGIALTPVEGEQAVLISLPSMGRGEERVLKLRIAD